MGDYLAALRAPQHSVGRPRDRAALFGQNVSQAAEFRRDLENWLSEHDLARDVAGIGEPLGLPLLTLTCTARVAQAIAALPQVESVTPDDDRALRLI